jgi:hypothetical protein
MANSVVILTNQTELSYTGAPAKGDGYYGFSDGLHTVSFHAKNMLGRVWLEATLLENPTEDDWFIIEIGDMTPYLEFDTETITKGVTFTGNFVFLRVSVDRSYLVSTEYDPAVHGVLDKAVLLI